MADVEYLSQSSASSAKGTHHLGSSIHISWDFWQQDAALTTATQQYSARPSLPGREEYQICSADVGNFRTYPETTRSSPIRSNQIQSGSIIEVPGPTLLFSLSKAVHRESPWWTMFGWQLGGFCCQLGRFKGAVKWQLHCRCTVCLFWQFRHFMSNFDAACHLWLTFRRYR